MAVSDDVKGSLKGLHMFRRIVQLSGKPKLSFESTVWKSRDQIITQLIKEAMNKTPPDDQHKLASWYKTFGITNSSTAAQTSASAPSKATVSSFHDFSQSNNILAIAKEKGFDVGTKITEVKATTGKRQVFNIISMTMAGAKFEELPADGAPGIKATLPLDILIERWAPIDESKTKLSFQYADEWVEKLVVQTDVYKAENAKVNLFQALHTYEQATPSLLNKLRLTGRPMALHANEPIKARELVLVLSVPFHNISAIGPNAKKPSIHHGHVNTTNTALDGSELWLMKVPNPPDKPVSEWGTLGYKGVVPFCIASITDEEKGANMEIELRDVGGLKVPCLVNRVKLSANTKLTRYIKKEEACQLKGAVITEQPASKKLKMK